MMEYNIDYEIMGMLVTIVIAYSFRMNYVSRTRSDKAFMRLVYFILASQILDMVTAITFSFENPKLNLINLIMTTGYFYCAFFTAVTFERYVATYIPEVGQKKIFVYIRKAVIAAYCIHGALNPFTKLAFYFLPDGRYMHGPWYYLGYLAPALFAVSSLYFIIRYRKRFAVKQWISSVAFLFVVFGAMILQAVFLPNVYLTFGLIPIALLMVLFSLETPDYRMLMKTLNELEQAKQEAWRANQVKSDFLANMSHEIRTPINAVLGFDEMILRESRNEEILSYAANIKNSGQTLLSLVNDILDLSKIEAGKMEIVTAEYDFLSRMSELLKMITPRAKDKGLKLICDIDEKIPRKLLGDDVRIAQVLTNLLTNAVKYTQKGEVTLRIYVKELSGERVTLFFAVKDTGIGIREEDREKLFSEFGRVEGEKTHRIEGTGLGLPITMNCLALMGSRLDLESVYGEGSVFSFTLSQGVADPEPIGDFEQARKESRNEVTVFLEDFIAPDAHILVVDDVELNLKVFKGLLKRSKLQIETAQSGAQAIELIRQNSYDLVFMDHQMPDMDGIETLHKLQDNPEIRLDGMPIIALTANAIAGARDMYLQNGFSDYLTKPIDGWALSAMLHKWLPKEKLRRAEERQEAEEEFILEFLPDHMEAEDSVKNRASGMLEPTETDEDQSSEEAMEINDTAVLGRLGEIGIDTKAGLSYSMNEVGFYLELLGDFAAGMERCGEEMSECFRLKDWKNYQVKVHALKSTAKMIGASELSEEARALEFAARDLDEKALQAKHGEMMDHYRETAEEIRKICK